MTGDSYNNKLKAQMSKLKTKDQKGQVLLITIMLLATAITVVLSLSFKSTTEIQTAKLEEEAQKALAAAEAGIERALREGAVSFDLGNIAVTSSEQTVSSTSFVTPLLYKDEQYSFYLADYPGLTTNYWWGNLTVYLGSETICPAVAAVELTFVKSDNSLERFLIDPCDLISSDESEIGTTEGGSLEGVNFAHKTSSAISVANMKLLVIRSLFTATKIGIQGSTNLPKQGKVIVSEAKPKSSNVGVTKKVQLFQSYPQIPSEFFLTSF